MYKKFAIITIAAVYFLILVGGVVRATGSGMGCPDWPKCFGTWIPPTHVSQLPENYQKIFGEKLKGEVEFHAFKTWVEYVNRLVGVLIGLFIFITLVFSYKEYKNTKSGVILYSFLAFVLVGVEGFLGSKVVSYELHPGLVTVHLVLAIFVVMLLIYALFLAYRYDKVLDSEQNTSYRFGVLILLILSFGQLILGTQIREAVDHLSFGSEPREQWVSLLLGGRFYIHIILGIILLISHGLLLKTVKKSEKGGLGLKFVRYLVLLVVLEFVVGGILGLFEIPAFAQPIHLTFATLIIGLQFSLYLIFGNQSAIKGN